MTRPSLEQERNSALLAWYSKHGRTLPWRASSDPYSVLVSEVMTQQTQVGRVVPHYKAFLARFPTVEAVAAAPLRDVIAAWSGLGYNNRAVRLHRAARRIVANGWPDTVSGLEQLPGVGPYTARAVAAIAFGAQVAAVDTNLRRVVSRWHGEPLSGSTLSRIAMGDIAEDAAAWNQAVMDLGAALCRPRLPRCDECPVESWCAGPDVYQPPHTQPRFEGSLRQIRGSIIRALVREPATLNDLATRTGTTHDMVREAIDQLIDEGLVEQSGDQVRLPE